MDPRDDTFFPQRPTARLRLPHAPAPLHAAPAPPPPPPTAPPVAELDARQAYGNGRQNGRAWTVLPAGPWHERWRQPLEAAPQLLTSADAHIVVAGSGRWSLFQVAGGAALAGGPMTGSALVLDGGAGRFLFTSRAGLLEGRALADGARQFLGGLTFGMDYARVFLTASGARAWAVGVEIPPPRSTAGPISSVIEVRAWQEPPRVNVDGITDARVEAILHRDELPLVVAGTGPTLVAATGRRLYWFDAVLQVQDVVEGDIAPSRLSLDEAERAYVLGARRLQVITRDGGRVYEAALPADVAPIAPALISPAHEAFVVGARRVVALDAGGRVRWSQPLDGAVGALVDAHGRLVVAEGRAVVAFDGHGARTALADAGAPVTTAPLLLSNGDLAVATAGHLIVWTADK